MKCILRLLSILSAAVLVTGCETTRDDDASACCAYARPRNKPQTAAQAVGHGLFRLGQSALYSAASDTAQKETPFPD